METLPKIQVLKAEAVALGIQFSQNIGVAKLSQRIKLHKVDNLPALVNSGVAPAPAVVAPAISAQQLKHDRREAKLKEATAMTRCIITCMNPAKARGSRQGEYVMAANNVVGTIKRLVPYGHVTHVEKILLDIMEEKVFQQRSGERGEIVTQVREFAIQILPPLTIQERHELVKLQALRAEAALV